MMLEHVDKLAEMSALAISNIKFDKVVVWEGAGGSNVNGEWVRPARKRRFLQNLSEAWSPPP